MRVENFSGCGGTRLKDMRVLVVEDEPLVAMLVEDELLGAGARIVGPAYSVNDALRLVEVAAADGGIDVAVLDINLSGRHVSPVAQKLAALGVPFLFATGYSDDYDRGWYGAVPMLHKPFDSERLIAAVEALAPVAV